MDEAAVCFAESQKTDGSDVNSETTSNNECPLSVCTRICLVGDVRNDSKTSVAAEKFGIPVVESDSGSEFLNDGTCDTVFITNDFSGPVFEAIHRSEQRIMGPTALQECAEKGDTLPHNSRPLYCHAMAGLVVCFTGFRKKDELNRMITLIHNMGGSIRKDMVAKVTHLIANNCGGEKYRYAVTFRVPIMSDTWVYKCWEQRDKFGFSAVSDEMMCHKMKPFVGARVCFYGFPDEERQHMTDILLQNGGEVTDVEDGTSTHVVVDGAEKYYLLKHRMVISKRWSLSPTSSTATTTNPYAKVTRLSNNQSTDLAPHQLTSPRCSTPYCHCGRNMENNSGASCVCVKDRKISPVSNGVNRCLSFGESVLHKCDVQSSSVDFENTMNESYVTLINDSGERHVFKQITNSVPKVRSSSLMEHAIQSAQHRKYIPKRSASLLKTEISVEDYQVPDKIAKFDIVSEKGSQSVNEESASKSARNTSFGLRDALFMEVITDSDRGRSPQFSSPTITALCKSTVKSSENPRVVQEDVLTELVVDESNVQSVPDLTINAPIVKAEWFWKSVQNEARADEKEHLFEDYLETAQSPPGWRGSQGTPSSTASVRARKRKRLRDVASRILQQNESPAVHKRRSSVSDAGLLSMSGSFLDSCPGTPDKQDEVEVLSETPRKNLSPRQQVFFELLQTESNYVGILDTIMTLFKSPLEDVSEQGGALLNNTELKIIFGNLPPIYEVHKQMLEELRSAAASWKEEISIGKIFLKYVPDLVKAYPPFVNFFENTKEMLVMCDQTKPRFHAFLKICQTKPECGRQSLQELLIRPVQRLPSISLLLNDILKHTSKSNPDHAALEKAIASIREVMTHINEDKRKTEGQLVMFDIFNDIDNCPPHLVSSHRSFIVRCDVMELSDGLSGRGDNLVFFLFSDTMEVCKKRSKTFNSLKSPNTTSSSHSAKLSSAKPFKHVRLMPLTHIKRVIDIRETDECHNVFALMCRSNQELKDKLYSFTIADEETEKLGFLRTLCRQMANTVCKTDAENFLMSLDSHQLDIDTSDVALGTLSKAFKFASRTRMKVGRAFSFNKTPSKLKRAVSTMMSPFGSTTNLTPASQLAQMRLASCNNLNELGSAPSKEETTLVAPLSVQPTRKNKSASLNMSSLRRL